MASLQATKIKELRHHRQGHETAFVVAQDSGHGVEHGVTEPPTFRKAPHSGVWVVPWDRGLSLGFAHGSATSIIESWTTPPRWLKLGCIRALYHTIVLSPQ